MSHYIVNIDELVSITEYIRIERTKIKDNIEVSTILKNIINKIFTINIKHIDYINSNN